MPKTSGLIFIAIFLVVISIVALSSGSLAAGFPYQANMPKTVLDTVTALIAIALFVERGMTVLNAILYGEEQRDIDIRLDQGTAAPQDLARVLGAKERMRLLGAFIAGLFVSAAGVRTLEWLLNIKDQQINPLLKPVDVVLTALLIAGGSNGLAYLLQIAKERLGSGASPSAQAAAAAPPPPPPPPRARGAGVAAQPINPALRARLITSG